MELRNKPRLIILLIVLALGVIVLFTSGLKYGLDFNGGTTFTLTLDKPVTDPDKMARVTTTIAQRLDWSGLKDVKVSSWEDSFVNAQVAVSDPEEIAKIEEVLQKQGRFENIFNAEVLFTGDDIVSVLRDPQKGYGITSNGEEEYRWSLPFVLNASAARNFANKTFHQCVPDVSGSYDCPETYFFIDRPYDSIILMSEKQYTQNEFLPADPLSPQGGKQIKIDQLLTNVNITYFIADTVDANLLSKIQDLIANENKTSVIVSEDYDVASIKSLRDFNIKVQVLETQDPYPWIWTATGLKSIIWLTEGITNQNAVSQESSNFEIFYNLVVTGSGRDQTEAQQKLDQTYVLLGAGSLPVGIESISKETLSPTLGTKFLENILLIGALAILTVGIVIYIRYRVWQVVLPIMLTCVAEVILILAFAALIKWNLDLAALAGIIAAVGTGVDSQIVVTDELSRDREEKQEQSSLIARVKRAFFIIFASAATAAASLVPLILFGYGLGKLVGFAITTLAGVLIGVF